MSYAEEDYLMISGIQHFVFCRRQWALIHIDQQWAENFLTAEGEWNHKNAHNEDFKEKRAGLLIVRGLRVASPQMGVSGQCDVVEFTQQENNENGAILQGHRGYWQVCPIEYKHGKDKQDESDVLQLCCQVMCLEEMLACHIPNGDIFYHAIRRRRKIELTEELRQRVKDTVQEMHHYFTRGIIPRVKTSRKCKSCSLQNICLPKLSKLETVQNYYQHMFQEDEE